MNMVRYCAGLLAMMLLPVSAHALTMRLCVDERSHLPFITPAGDGTAGLLIRSAAREVGIQVEFYGAPITRCREEIRAGVSDGFPTAPYTVSLLPFMSFPMNRLEPDAERAVMLARAMVFRRHGSQAGWDGKRFTKLEMPALVPFGAVMLVDRLQSMQVPVDDKGKTLDANFDKLLAGRGDVAIGAEYSGYALMADPRYAGKVEAVPAAFSEEPYYLALSKRFRDTNPDSAEQLWNAIGRIRKSPAYLDQFQKALTQAAKTLKE